MWTQQLEYVLACNHWESTPAIGFQFTKEKVRQAGCGKTKLSSSLVRKVDVAALPGYDKPTDRIELKEVGSEFVSDCEHTGP